MNKKVLKQIIIVILVLLAGFLIFKLLAALRKEPAKKEQVVSVPLLNARKLSPEDVQVVAHGFGNVEAKTEVQVIPQVSGRVIELHKNLVNGGFFEANEALVKIDPRDYEFAVQTAMAAVSQARVTYEKELAEQKIALEEWAILHPNEDPNSPLLTRELQVKGALAEYEAAKARLKDAELDLERTVISVPFEGRVQQEEVDLGQYVTPGKNIAEVYATDSVEIIVPLADTQLEWFDVPLGYVNGSRQVSNGVTKVKINADFGGNSYKWQGKVVRLQGRIDEISRMVNVVVEVEDPFEINNGRPPLVPGMFVEVDILGKDLKDVFLVPRFAVHNDDEVWIEEDGKLKIVYVDIVRSDKMYAYVKDGLNDGDVVITSPLDVVTDGMAIRTHLVGSLKKK